jgi:hypothetical protein
MKKVEELNPNSSVYYYIIIVLTDVLLLLFPIKETRYLPNIRCTPFNYAFPGLSLRKTSQRKATIEHCQDRPTHIIS